uniref:Programmed cell death 6-interacting protein n=1 Tax=Anthurium amnicola TaxID=1678845 RepID=A0A1D1ZE25_9ARAE
MLLRFQDPLKLKTKKIVFEDAFHAHDSGTLEQLKELSSRRKVIEESVNESSFITEAIAREMAGGLTSKIEQDLKKLECYIPLLKNLVMHCELLQSTPKVLQCISDLKIQWSSALNASSIFNLGGPKFFRIDNLHFELAMILFLYGAHLRERAFEVLSEDLVQSTTLYRKAAGVYNYLANVILPPLQPASTKEIPLEATTMISSVMSLICLAEAQAVTIQKAEERKGSSNLLVKLHFGITQMLDTAASVISSKGGESNDISARLMEFIYSCSILYQLRSQKHLAVGLTTSEEGHMMVRQVGVAIGVLRYAINRVKSTKAAKDESWRSVFNQEIVDVAELLRKLEYENELVCHEKIPDVDGLPVLQGLRIVEAIPFEPQRWERELVFMT